MERTNGGVLPGVPRQGRTRTPAEATLPGILMHAIGWCALFAACRATLSPADQAIVLYVIAAAEAASALIASGTHRFGTRYGKRQRSLVDLAQITLRWGIFALPVTFAQEAGLIRLLANHPKAPWCLIGLIFLLALVRFVSTCRLSHGRGGVALANLRHVLLAGLIWSMASLAPLSAELALFAAILVLTCLLLLLMHDLPRLMTQPESPTTRVTDTALLRQPCRILRQADLVLVGALLAPPAALTYLLARGFAATITIALDGVQNAASVAVSTAFRSGSGFVATAARTNLGVMLLGGGIAVCVLTATPFASDLLGGEADSFWQIIFWLALAASAPAIFGATPLLMRVTKMEQDVAIITGVAGLAIIVVAAVADLRTPLDIARLVAGTELGAAAASALVLGLRIGIWPGLTALLFRQIRLL